MNQITSGRWQYIVSNWKHNCKENVIANYKHECFLNWWCIDLFIFQVFFPEYFFLFLFSLVFFLLLFVWNVKLIWLIKTYYLFLSIFFVYQEIQFIQFIFHSNRASQFIFKFRFLLIKYNVRPHAHAYPQVVEKEKIWGNSRVV